ncbi:PAS domain-containing sensor histidine kinase [Microbacterium rhizophilus]|uniref:PAS domain-containing sensor histidine kinase n=1 Tax=Microbacterium rhizophilus TaxID=3138934 RepID=UPI0031E60009
MTEASESSAAEALIPAILSATPQPIWVVGADGAVLYVNEAALAVLGYRSSADVIGHDSHTLMHATRPDGSPYPVSECPMLAPLHTGEPVHGEEWLRRTDGTFAPIEWSSAPIDLPAGRGVIHSFVDVSERRELERQRRERKRAEMRRAELRRAHLRLMENIAEARSQIVRDLHDGAQQRLVAVALQARLLQETLGAQRDDTRELLDGIVDDAQGAIDELRELTAGIHPPILTSRGLVAAVRSQADRCPFPVTISGDLGGRRLTPLLESNAYFFVAEALTNAVKHARAGHVEVQISLGDRLVLEIEDDGIGGLDLAGAGSGLHSMTDRVRAFEGDVEIDSPPGAGTRIRATIPLPPAGEGPQASR